MISFKDSLPWAVDKCYHLDRYSASEEGCEFDGQSNALAKAELLFLPSCHQITALGLSLHVLILNFIHGFHDLLMISSVH